jgi:hypothetical protein
MDALASSWLGWVVSVSAAFATGWYLTLAYYAVTDRLPFLRLHLREVASYRLHLLLIIALSRLLKLEVAREVRKDFRRRGW